LVFEQTIAIGDIHGCFRALASLLDAIELRPADAISTALDVLSGRIWQADQSGHLRAAGT
jgi:hypothetical protein